jgi:hypothetical protein
LTIGILGGIIGTYFSMEELIIEGIDNGIHF